MLDRITENALVKMAKKIDFHNEVQRNKLEQANRNKVNHEYIRVMGLA